MPSKGLIFAVPVIALLIIGVLFYATYFSSRGPAVESFRTFLLIDVQQKGLKGTVRIYPNGTIGQPGGIMSTMQYLSYGVNGRYPVYTLDRTGVIYVESSVARDYTLGDFFNVWGEPLGPNNTLNLRFYNGTDTCGTATCSPYYWTMCIQGSSPNLYIPNDDWGNHVLKDQEIIRLTFSQIGCA